MKKIQVIATRACDEFKSEVYSVFVITPIYAPIKVSEFNEYELTFSGRCRTTDECRTYVDECACDIARAMDANTIEWVDYKPIVVRDVHTRTIDDPFCPSDFYNYDEIIDINLL